MNGYTFCCLYMTQIQANTASDSGSWHTSCAVLRAYSSANSCLRGMHLTPLQLCLLCSDLPPFQCTQLKSLFPLLFFSHIFEPCTSLGINWNPTVGKKQQNKPPKNVGIVYNFNAGYFALLQ